MRLIVLILFFGSFFSSGAAFAGSACVLNATGNWSAAGTWTNCAGAHPTSGDTVTTGATAYTLTVDVNSTVSTIDFTGFTGQLVMSHTLTVWTGTFTMVAGMTYSGTADLIFKSSGTVKSGGVTITGGVQFVGTTQTFTLGDSWTINGSLTINGSGTQHLNSNSMTVKGNLVTTTPIMGTTVINMAGTGTWSGTQTLLNDVNFEGTITITGSVSYTSGTMTLVSGTVDATAANLTLGSTGSGTVNVAGATWHSLTLGATTTATITLKGDLNVSGAVSAGCNTQTYTMNSNPAYTYNLNVGGNLNLDLISTGILTGNANIIMNGSGTSTFSMNGVTAGGSGVIKNNLEIKSTGTVNLTGPINYSTGTLTYTSGTVVVTGTLTLSVSTAKITSNHSGLAFGAVVAGSGATFNGSNDFSMTSFTDTTAGAVITLANGRTYTITGGGPSSLTLSGSSASPILLSSDLGGTAANLVLATGSTTEVAFVNPTDINSSLGMLIWDFSGTIPASTTNWNSFTYPTTQAATF